MEMPCTKLWGCGLCLYDCVWMRCRGWTVKMAEKKWLHPAATYNEQQCQYLCVPSSQDDTCAYLPTGVIIVI